MMENGIEEHGNTNSALQETHSAELLCDACQERTTQARSFSLCSHSFCQSCLENGISQVQMECPICPKISPAARRDLADSTNTRLSPRVTEDVFEEDDGRYQRTCQQHQCVLDQYCKPCNELLCSECLQDPKHKEHLQRGDIHLAQEILPKCLTSLSNQLAPAGELVSQVVRLTEGVEQKKRELSSSGQQTACDINAFFKEAEKHLEKRRKVLLAAVEGDLNSKLAALDKHSKQLAAMHKSTLGTTKAVKKLCQSREVCALTEKAVLEQNLQEVQQSLEQTTIQLQDGGLAHILKFQGEKQLEQQIGTSGTLTVCEVSRDASYLIIRHQLKVTDDGNVFVETTPQDSTPIQASTPTESGDDTYAHVPTETMPVGSLPDGCATDTIFPQTLQSPQANEHYDVPQKLQKNRDYDVPRPSPCYDVLSPASQTYDVPRPSLQYNVPQMSPLYDIPPSSGTTQNSVLQNDTSTQRKESTSSAGTLASPGGDYTLTESGYAQISRQVEGRIQGSDSESDVDNEEGFYEVIPPRLPPVQRSLSNASTLAVVVRPSDRGEPEIIRPVRVINSDQLREPESTDNVFPTGICLNSADVITITDLHNHCLREVSRDCRFVRTYRVQGKPISHFNSPIGIAQNANHMYVVNHGSGLGQRLTLNGEYVSTFGRRHLRTPRAIAISQVNGNIYVSDSKKQRVYIYRSDGSYLRPIGKLEKNIQFEHPVGVAFDTTGNLLVVDRGQIPCIWHISQPEGKLLGKFGEHYLHYPSDIAVTRDDIIVVTERGKANCVSVFSPHGEVIRCFGKTGSKPGEFNGPSGVAINSQGQVIVADQHNQRLQIFDLSNEDV